jgi:hypothetical protein
MTSDEALKAGMPFSFVSFPSAKDPEWSKNPARKNKRSEFQKNLRYFT